ncbi:hypothetical protein B0O44_106217 [Pedobacter nutrimenti]|uniref:DUF4919 domain-containing protein n=2 Tax=Pedobacter nutrimenti TaxID=1241337 RepID=A0A318UBG0_9SPHI|nr:hypothetical protein B0O44_106217 [Pedobacter nutrimenti]
MLTRSALFFLSICLPLSLLAQEGAFKEASTSSQAYHKYRLKNTVPPYGLVKVKALVAAIKPSGDDYSAPLNQKAYLELSLREKFTYHMLHAESSSQNCDVMPPILDEDQKIFAQLPDAFDEYSWSERQRNFLNSKRDSVLALIKESVTRSKRVGLNYKTAIVEVNGRELIPFLIQVYKQDHKDYDILTVLMLLMKKNEYGPFMNSASFVKLYGLKSDYQSFINFNAANEALILSRASAFYAGGH